jgi:tetratricopeptide (TPR) repeat protein
MQSNIWDDELESDDENGVNLELSAQQRLEKILAIKQSLERVTSLEQAIPLLIQLGNSLVADGQYDSAIESYDNAIGIDSECDRAWNNRGLALSQVGKNREAIESFERAIAIEPENREAWNCRGFIPIWQK